MPAQSTLGGLWETAGGACRVRGEAEKCPALERVCPEVRFNKRTGENKFYYTILFHSLP